MDLGKMSPELELPPGICCSMASPFTPQNFYIYVYMYTKLCICLDIYTSIKTFVYDIERHLHLNLCSYINICIYIHICHFYIYVYLLFTNIYIYIVVTYEKH